MLMMNPKNWLIFIVLFCLGVVITVGITLHVNKDKIENYAEYVQLKEAELNYWASKADLVDAVNDYIHSVAPMSNLSGVILVDKCEEYKIDIKFVLAQGHLESHFGTKGLATKTNSVWNVGAFDSLSLNEIKHTFSNPNQSVEPYLKLLREKYITSKCETGLLENFVSVDGYRYATSPSYETSLRHKYEVITNTTKIDSLQEVFRYWIVQSNREY